MSRRINIPFKAEMAELIFKGRKFATTRNKVYGQVGDWFYIGNRKFEITSIFKTTLAKVAELHYIEEGFNSAASFTAYWIKLHPRKQFDSNQSVYFHKFNEAKP